VDGLDDFAAVDPLQVDGGDAEVAVAELALDDDRRYAVASDFNGVGVAELVRCEATSYSCRGRRAPELRACGGDVRAWFRCWRRARGPTESSRRMSSQGWSCSQPDPSMPTSRRRPRLPRRTRSEPRR
jgi:hypothetical protein